MDRTDPTPGTKFNAPIITSAQAEQALKAKENSPTSIDAVQNGYTGIAIATSKE
jgi:hypothetical protein